MRNDGALLRAKTLLYREFLKLEPKEIAEGEVDLMYELAKDRQIQRLLAAAFREAEKEKEGD